MSHSGKTFHINAFLMGVGHHEAAWRLPESDPFANTEVGHYQQLARIAERGLLDSVFFADSPSLMSHPARPWLIVSSEAKRRATL